MLVKLVPAITTAVESFGITEGVSEVIVGLVTMVAVPPNATVVPSSVMELFASLAFVIVASSIAAAVIASASIDRSIILLFAILSPTY